VRGYCILFGGLKKELNFESIKLERPEILPWIRVNNKDSLSAQVHQFSRQEQGSWGVYVGIYNVSTEKYYEKISGKKNHAGPHWTHESTQSQSGSIRSKNLRDFKQCQAWNWPILLPTNVITKPWFSRFVLSKSS
jgi:hypothetical protein